MRTADGGLQNETFVLAGRAEKRRYISNHYCKNLTKFQNLFNKTLQ